MKSFPLILLFLFTTLAIQAQDSYRKEKRNVMGVSYNGFSTTVPFSEHRTSQYLSSYLKSNGKIGERRNFTEIKDTYWKSKEDPTKVYALVLGDSTESRIWIGYSPEASDSLTTAIKSQMESLPALMHKYHLQQQIKEAEEAASYLSRKVKSTERDEQRLQDKAEQTAREKIILEQALEQNAKNKIQLEQDIVSIKKTKEDKVRELEEVKRQLQYLKEKASRL